MPTKIMTYNPDGTPRCTTSLCKAIETDGCLDDLPDEFVVGYTISGMDLTIEMKDGTTYTVTLPIFQWIDDYFKAKPTCT